MSELSQLNLQALGLVETNAVRLDEALKTLHLAIIQMDLEQMRVFAKREIAQQAFALVNAYAQMDEGLRTIGLPFFQEPSAPQTPLLRPILGEMSGLQFQYFNGLQAVCSYVVKEMLDTLREDLYEMEESEARHYEGKDRTELRQRIADIEQVGTFLEQLPELL